jgi:polar amino acid transport system substrate-binding protein
VRLDAVIAPEQTAQNAIKNGYPLRIIEGDYAFREPLVVIADKGDAEWTTKIGGIIDQMKKDGTLATLTTKWYGKNYSAD